MTTTAAQAAFSAAFSAAQAADAAASAQAASAYQAACNGRVAERATKEGTLVAALWLRRESLLEIFVEGGDECRVTLELDATGNNSPCYLPKPGEIGILLREEETFDEDDYTEYYSALTVYGQPQDVGAFLRLEKNMRYWDKAKEVWEYSYAVYQGAGRDDGLLSPRLLCPSMRGRLGT